MKWFNFAATSEYHINPDLPSFLPPGAFTFSKLDRIQASSEVISSPNQLAGDDADGNYDGDDNYDGDANCDYDQDYEC